MGALRAGIYGRNSKGEAKSIADQVELGLAAADEHGWTLAGTPYSDDSSASQYRTKDRKDWPRLLADLAAGKIDILVLWKSARGSRDDVDWSLMLRQCEQRGVLIHIVADQRTYDPRLSRDWKSLAEDGINSAYYSKELSENVTRGVRKSAEKGGVHGRIPFGFTREYDPQTRKFVAQRPSADAPIVVEIFERLATSTPISELVRDFNERGLASPSGTWHRNTIRTVATNVSYVGQRRRPPSADSPGEGPYNGVWDGLVDPDLFGDVQVILGQPDRKTTKPGRARFLLSYIATAPCGGLIQRQAPKPGRADRYCCTADSCVSIARAVVDDIVSAAVVARFRQPGRIRALFEGDGSDARAARTEAARLRLRVEDARRSFETPDGISADALARIERNLGPLIEDADRRGRTVGMPAPVDRLLDADDAQAVWDDMPIAAQRVAVSALVTVVIGPTTRALTRWATADDREAEALVRLGESSWKGDARKWRELLRD